ncbi:cysteine desulfurase family protein [Alkalibacillus aidingensis]|uniref:cysteine desulfurase family protein n=1 Tax=Alkalibacillus aidingensis TaxID=2747607 RepID=UPI001660C4BE|nr:cysteine desulfurase family protein [Alkalibacillus aidingensis]
MIYLDNSATTKPHIEVLKTYQTVASEYFANPSSIHRLGGEVEKLINKAKEQVASILKVKSSEVFFTSGGTESNNLAIKGIAYRYQNRGKHIITTQIEHPSVLEVCKFLEANGFKVTYLPVNEHGEISLQDLEKALTNETILVTIMHVNNEIGTVQPISDIADMLIQYPKTFFHIDHVQGFGKLPLPYDHKGIDSVTISGHKIHGLKGTGCLIKKESVSLAPLFHGGQQEQGNRPGTENVAGAVSLAKAARLAKESQTNYDQLYRYQANLREVLEQYDQVTINSPKHGAAHILNFSVKGFKPEVLIHAFMDEGIVVSTKSACSSKQNEPSHVLLACGIDQSDASSAVRVSMNLDQKAEDIESFLQTFNNIIRQYENVMG